MAIAIRRPLVLALAVLLLTSVTLAVQFQAARPAAAAVPTGFTEVTVWSGLQNPTAVRFAPDGKVFVAEKRGLIKMFDTVDDTTPTVVADLRTEVHNYWDRGLLGLAVDPSFPARPYLYASYTFDGPIGGTAPRWGTPGADSDPCPTPPGPTTDGCVVSGKLVRLAVDLAAPSAGTTGKTDLVHDWCQQYPSHSVGDLVFGRDGALYASGGDGASFDWVDYGQDGSPVNPCGDPPGGVGGAMTAPTAEGGALRAQDLRTSGDPVGLEGTVIRVSPETGLAMPDNPNATSPDLNAARIVASGLRNPFRMTTRPGTDELWIGDVGWSTYEEINRLAVPTSGPANFGWPCYEGDPRQTGYDAADLRICEDLYAQATADTKPYFSYRHGQPLNASDNCNVAKGSSTSGLAFEFYSGGPYPAEYDGALFFSDFSRNCIWVMTKGTDGLPDRLKVKPFVSGAAGPVDVELSPSGELFYADFNGGTVRRIVYSTSGTTCPSEQYLAEYFPNTTLSGTPVTRVCEPGPLNHQWGAGGAPGVGIDYFSARWTGTFTFPSDATYTFTARTDDGMRVWIDGVLLLDEWRNQLATFTRTRALTAGPHEVRVDYFETNQGAVSSLSWTGGVTNAAPQPTIAGPLAGTTWKVGDTIPFSGSATDPEDGVLDAGRLTWQTVLQHCPSACHSHPLESWPGVADGSFTAPDHEYPSHVELRLTATDSKGQATTVSRRLDPQTTTVRIESQPAGLQVALGSQTAVTPFTRTLIVGSTASLSAPSPQTGSGITYQFSRWSDDLGQSHNIAVGSTPATYTATYTATGSCPAGQYRAEYFGNKTLSGAAARTACEAGPQLDRSWGSGGPAGVGTNNFSARWTGVIPFTGGSTTFTAASDDGIRVWVDGVPLVDRWGGSGTSTATRTLTPGDHVVRVDYFEKSGHRLRPADVDAGLTQRTGGARGRGSSRRARSVAAVVVAVVVCSLAAVVSRAAPAAAAVPAGFIEVTAFSGLIQPTSIRFAPDGRIFVAEKRGVVKVFEGLGDTSPTVVVDLRTEVHNFWDRGMLGLAVDPGYPARPYLYVLYTFDGPIGGSAPRWGTANTDSDPCPTPPGANADGCVVSGKLARLTVAPAHPDRATTVKRDLIHDWCGQYPSHTVGDLVFGRDGALYVSGGDGASFTFTDWGQDGSPVNPCGDPPGGVGGSMTPPTAQGGALRSQDLRTATDPVTLDGTVIRVDPDTGAALPTNPNAGATTANARRIVAYGFRNPFRITARPGTDDIWLGDVGAGTWEEINRIPSPAGALRNYGWPCYEGAGRQPAFDAADLSICENLYAQAGAHTGPYFAYRHDQPINGADTCAFAAGSSGSGVSFAFSSGGAYPPEYDGALFFADYTRRCIWSITRGADGLLNRDGVRPFVSNAAGPVDLEMSPAGELFYVDMAGGTIRRVVHRPASCPVGQYLAQYFPNRTLTGTPARSACEAGPLDHEFGTSSPAGLPVDGFSARWSGTFDFAAGTYTFRADTSDGMRVWVDGTLLVDQWRDQARSTFSASRVLSAGPHEVRVEWYEATGEAVAGLSWAAAGAEDVPQPQITAPAVGTTWRVGDTISFAGSATDPQDGTLPPSALSWEIVLQHCPSACHAHPVRTLTGSSGTFVAEDHEYPAHLELRLTATDSDGQAATVTRRLDPRTVAVTMTSRPAGLQLTLGSRTAATPFTGTVIAGGTVTVAAPSPQTLSGGSYAFQRWSDGGARAHNITVGTSATTLTAVLYATSCPAGQYRAEYYPNRTLTAPAYTVWCEAAPLARWMGSGGPPGTAVGVDDFSARWTGTFGFPGGTETFTATHNNGMRVWLDGVAILDRWGVTGTASTTRSVTTGSHAVRVEFWEGTGEATADLRW